MDRKKPEWTKAMRKAAGVASKRASKEAKQRAGQMGGAVTWATRSAEQQEAIRTRLRAAGGHQTNESKAAKEAQRARGKAGMDHLTARKASFLAYAGILKSRPGPILAAPTPRLEPVAQPTVVPVAPPPLLMTGPAPSLNTYLPGDPQPTRATFGDGWMIEFLAWAKVQDAAGLRKVEADGVE